MGLKEFQDSDRAWTEAMESKRLALALVQQQQEEAEEEKAKKDLEQKSKEEEEVEDSNSEYVLGPAQYTFIDNEIIVTKPKVKKVLKKKDVERPTSNPLPPKSEAFSDYLTTPSSQSQQVLDNVAKENQISELKSIRIIVLSTKRLELVDLVGVAEGLMLVPHHHIHFL